MIKRVSFFLIFCMTLGSAAAIAMEGGEVYEERESDLDEGLDEISKDVIDALVRLKPYSRALKNSILDGGETQEPVEDEIRNRLQQMAIPLLEGIINPLSDDKELNLLHTIIIDLSGKKDFRSSILNYLQTNNIKPSSELFYNLLTFFNKLDITFRATKIRVALFYLYRHHTPKLDILAIYDNPNLLLAYEEYVMQCFLSKIRNETQDKSYTDNRSVLKIDNKNMSNNKCLEKIRHAYDPDKHKILILKTYWTDWEKLENSTPSIKYVGIFERDVLVKINMKNKNVTLDFSHHSQLTNQDFQDFLSNTHNWQANNDITEINIQNQRLTKLDLPALCKQYPNLREINAQNNNISNLSQIFFDSMLRSNFSVNLKGNPINNPKATLYKLEQQYARKNDAWYKPWRVIPLAAKRYSTHEEDGITASPGFLASFFSGSLAPIFGAPTQTLIGALIGNAALKLPRISRKRYARHYSSNDLFGYTFNSYAKLIFASLAGWSLGVVVSAGTKIVSDSLLPTKPLKLTAQFLVPAIVGVHCAYRAYESYYNAAYEINCAGYEDKFNSIKV